jgi:integrase
MFAAILEPMNITAHHSKSVGLTAERSDSVATAPLRFNFTKRAIEGVALPERRYITYNDTTVRGLQLMAFASGVKTFVLYRRIAGRPERIKIGAFPDLSVEKARGEAQRLNSVIAQGHNPAQEKRTLSSEMTFAQLFAKYLDEYAKPRKRTWQGDVDFNRLYLGSLQSRKLSSITRADIVKIHNEIGKRTKRKPHGAPYAANRAAALLSVIFNFARDCGWPHENPATEIKRFDEEKRERFLDQDELRRFFESLAQETDITMRDYFLTALLTGARSRQNVLAMRWEEIKWERSVWVIPAEKSKKKKPMEIVLVPLMIALLEHRQALPDADDEWVFPGRIGRTTKGHIVEPKIAWERITKRAGIEGCRIHDLRRTHGSWQAMLGSSLTIIGASLGHSSLQATQVYARLNASPVRDSVERATNAMFAGVLPKGLLPEGVLLPKKA